MRAIVTGADTLLSLSPTAFIAYLRAHTWEMVDKIGNKGAVWSKVLPAESGGGDAEILLPLDKTLRDYVRRVGEAL